MIYVLSVLFTTLFVYYTKHQLHDLWKKRNTKWKTFGWGMRVIFVVGCFLMQQFPATWQHYLLASILSIAWFDIGINLIALKEKWHYVGTTSKWDRIVGKKKWWIYAILVLSSLVIIIFVE